MYLKENQARHMVIIHNDSLPAPLITTQPERKEVPTSSTRQETTTQATSAADTNISQVTPLLGITPHESSQLQNTNTQEDIDEILGTEVHRHTYSNSGWDNSQPTKTFPSTGPRS